jgi:cytoskeletal protein RodZ
VAGLLLAGSVATGAYAAGSPGASTPSVTTQTQTTPPTQTQDVQSGVQQGSQSQSGLDTEQAVAETPEADSQAAAAVDPPGGPDQNLQQGSQLDAGGQAGAADGQ